MFKYKTSKHN